MTAQNRTSSIIGGAIAIARVSVLAVGTLYVASSVYEVIGPVCFV